MWWGEEKRLGLCLRVYQPLCPDEWLTNTDEITGHRPSLPLFLWGGGVGGGGEPGFRSGAGRVWAGKGGRLPLPRESPRQRQSRRSCGW